MDHLGLFEVTKEAQNLGVQGHNIDRRPSFGNASHSGVVPFMEHTVLTFRHYACQPAWCVFLCFNNAYSSCSCFVTFKLMWIVVFEQYTSWNVWNVLSQELENHNVLSSHRQQ